MRKLSEKIWKQRGKKMKELFYNELKKAYSALDKIKKDAKNDEEVKKTLAVVYSELVRGAGFLTYAQEKCCGRWNHIYGILSETDDIPRREILEKICALLTSVKNSEIDEYFALKFLSDQYYTDAVDTILSIMYLEGMKRIRSENEEHYFYSDMATYVKMYLPGEAVSIFEETKNNGSLYGILNQKEGDDPDKNAKLVSVFSLPEWEGIVIGDCGYFEMRLVKYFFEELNVEDFREFVYALKENPNFNKTLAYIMKALPGKTRKKVFESLETDEARRLAGQMNECGSINLSVVQKHLSAVISIAIENIEKFSLPDGDSFKAIAKNIIAEKEEQKERAQKNDELMILLEEIRDKNKQERFCGTMQIGKELSMSEINRYLKKADNA